VEISVLTILIKKNITTENKSYMYSSNCTDCKLVCSPRVRYILGLNQRLIEMDICCISPKHATLRSKSKHWFKSG